jgi:hypothetical protein
MADLSSRIAVARVKKQAGRFDDELLFEAIGETTQLALDLTRVAEESARQSDKDAALQVLHGFENIGRQYRRPSGVERGIVTALDVDLARFVGHELFVSFIAVLLKHQRWELIGAVLSEPILVDTDDGPRSRNFSALSAHVGLLQPYFQRRGQHKLSPSAELLRDRHSGEGELAASMPWRQFVDTDYLLFLRAAFDLPADHFQYVVQGWRPWSYPYLAELGAPEWLVRAESRQYLARVCSALESISADEFRIRYARHAAGAERLFDQSLGFPVQLPDASKLGSRP